jgi:hypothetical protein
MHRSIILWVTPSISFFVLPTLSWSSADPTTTSPVSTLIRSRISSTTSCLKKIINKRNKLLQINWGKELAQKRMYRDTKKIKKTPVWTMFFSHTSLSRGGIRLSLLLQNRWLINNYQNLPLHPNSNKLLWMRYLKKLLGRTINYLKMVKWTALQILMKLI